jgi:hypothetical protein
MDPYRKADLIDALIDVVHNFDPDDNTLLAEFPDLHLAIESLIDALQVDTTSPNTIIETHIHQLFP